MKLIIGNKNYSSWSLRAWLLLKHPGIPFDEEKISFNAPDFKERVKRYSPVGKVPVLVDDEVVVWDSLAIAEYVAEKHWEKKLWPEDRAARAHARSICAEMHSGFQALRTECPMNVRRRERSQRFKAQRLGELEPASSSEFPSPERHVLAQRAAHALRALLDELPAPQAEVLCLHHMVGLTALEIATIAGVPLETVRSRLRLGRKALMARVHGDEQLLDTLGVSDGTDR